MLTVNEIGFRQLPVGSLGLALQAALMVHWARRKVLLRDTRGVAAGQRALRWLNSTMRLVLIAIAVVLAGSLAFERSGIEPFLWAICLMTAAGAIAPFQWRGWKQMTATVLLLLVGVIPAIAVLEIGCRILFPMAAPNVSMTSYDREALWTLGPGASGKMTFGSSALGAPFELSTYSVNISSQGLRDREFGPKEDGELRVLLLGDSFTFGWGLEIEQTVGRQLEAMLNASGSAKRFTVINAGVDGYGPWQERIRLREIGFALEPDIVVLQLFPGNDLNNSLNKVGKRVRAFDPVWEYLVESRRHWGLWEVRSDDWLRKRSAFYNQLGKALNTASPLMKLLDDLRFYRRKTPPLPKSADRPFWLEVHMKEWYPELNEGRQILESDTLAIRDDCENRGIAFALYAVPDVNSVCDYSWEWNMKKVEDASIYERAKDLKVVEEFCAREKLNCIDLASAMRASGDPCKLYYEADGHLTPKGAMVTARAIFDVLVSTSALPTVVK
ncbi:MAG: hypothetical protein IT367_12425 [Candidatus Hydrogenedentes bacterium]|nr:hypothetical protein [Candidatus Hydrogenedentota bacterium]